MAIKTKPLERIALVAKMVDATDLKSVGTSRAGSIPAERTNRTRSSMAEPAAHNGLVVGSTPTGSTKSKRVTKKSRVAKLLKMGLKPTQIAQVTGIPRQTVNIYIWQIRNSAKVKQDSKNYIEKNKTKIKEAKKKYYEKNKDWLLEQSRENWKEHYGYIYKCRRAGVVI